MSREIKFRTWQEGKMFYHELQRYLGSSGIINPYVGCDDAIWMQYTGLKDKNGKEIYEGDVLFGREEGNGETTAWTDVYLIVFFKDGCFKVREKKIDENSVWCDNLCDNDFTEEYEIIGNIYENPDLLIKN